MNPGVVCHEWLYIVRIGMVLHVLMLLDDVGDWTGVHGEQLLAINRALWDTKAK